MKVAISHEHQEQQLIQRFFDGTHGFFVEVGANHPYEGSQSWHLEQRGWKGILVEPLPGHAKICGECVTPRFSALPAHRQRMPGGSCLSLDRNRMVPGSQPESVIEVRIRTLNDILVEAKAPQPIDFLSVDIEGHEVEVLSGLDLTCRRPRLILLEDHVGDLRTHRFVKSAGYRLVRRTGFNGWYVPASSLVRFGWRDRWQILRKYYLALPFRTLRNTSRQLRQPFKDRSQARRHRM
jgi:FkbM family methyltransferase